MPAQRPGRQPRQTAIPRLISDSRAPGQARQTDRLILAGGLLILVASLFAGCAVDPRRDAAQVLETLPAKPLTEAQALERSGQPAAAAEAYLELAETASAPARQQLELEAAGALLQAGDADGASRILLGMDRSALTASQREAALLLQADIALSRGRAAEAIDTLERVNRGALPTDLKIRFFGSLAAAYRMSNQSIRAASTLNELDRLLDDREARMDNQVSLLFTLTSLNTASLREAAASSQGRMRSWIELAQLLVGQSAPSPQLNASLREWRQRHRGSPALTGLDDAYFATLAGGYATGTDAWVLVPTGGQFGGAGRVLKDGIQAAYDADHSGTRPNLRFSSGSGYSEAIAAGADLVIGPLQKSSVAALAREGALPVPTLALNRTGGSSTENLFQFSLAPEDEAMNAANYAWTAGLRRAGLIYPQSAWGTRMAQAFRNQWRALGGSLVAQSSYGAPRAAALEIASADANADVVFLVATSSNVAELWSALQDAGNQAPVVATSHVYDGDLDPARDQRLNELYFVDIPWLLDQQRSDRLSRQALREALPNISGPLARLYAMGIDAYRLAPRIAEMGRQPGTFFPGETGGLSVDSRGEVRRQLVLAQFTDRGVITASSLGADADARPDRGRSD